MFDRFVRAVNSNQQAFPWTERVTIPHPRHLLRIIKTQARGEKDRRGKLDGLEQMFTLGATGKVVIIFDHLFQKNMRRMFPEAVLETLKGWDLYS